jgi:hypothetical protein
MVSDNNKWAANTEVGNKDISRLWLYGAVYLYAVSHVEIWKDEEFSNDLAN